MSIKPGQVKKEGGDILVGHGLLMAPALLLEKKLSLDEGRLLDFSTFINALTLHDRLITLPAVIPGFLKDSRLYQYLEKNKILCHLDFDYNSLDFKDSPQRRSEMEGFIGRPFSQDEANLVMGNTRDLFYTEYFLEEHLGRSQNIEHQRNDFINEIITMKRENWTGGGPEKLCS